MAPPPSTDYLTSTETPASEEQTLSPAYSIGYVVQSTAAAAPISTTSIESATNQVAPANSRVTAPAIPSPGSLIPTNSKWPLERLKSAAAGGFLGALVGLLAQKLFIIAITAYLGTALIHAGLPVLQDKPQWLLALFLFSIAAQSGLAWKFLRKATGKGD